MLKTKQFDDLLSYKNPNIIRRYRKKYNLSGGLAEKHFNEMLKFLWICSKRKEPSAPSAKLDNVWHEFILNTNEYKNFCDKYFGKFINHNPSDNKETEKYNKTRQFAEENFEKLDQYMWPKNNAADCDGTCTGDNYCSDSC